MGRTSTARERLLDAACGLMLSRGYGTIGVAEICARADVKKGSFYHFFESKQALTIEAINAHWAAQRPGWVATLRGDGPAEDRLERLFLDQAAAQRTAKAQDGAVNGCLFGNLALELSTQDAAVRARLAEIFEEQIDLVHAALTDAAEQGTIPTPAATRTTARAVLAQLEGMVMFAKLANDPAVLDGLWAQTSRLLRN
ncbi:TetR/AcrR family transcriptional regulator [Streptomyces sp. ISL-98]|uniref:TetR/AcrR family transcriptional regulator n=1 Tax=Streptomyces sp. ISL-98 TaxID=2819192 RepID=UPI001BE70B25|nr:TetR/AcrR family transcriptional regulator [Streptomyces sp. ISL-98]MBT2507637.1 TetR/AcrR family transcriptional regulator [Streptomyces sp. ISL-98]